MHPMRGMGKPPYPNADFSILNQRDGGGDEEFSYSDEYETRSRRRSWNQWQLASICLGCLCCALLPLLGASFFVNSWAVDALEASGLQTFGVPTTVASVDISPFTARWTMRGLEVASPPGFGAQNFLSVGTGIFDMGLRAMFFSPLDIQELALQDVQVSIDQRVDGSSNAKTIMEHISTVSASAASKQFEEMLMNKKVTVQKITFTNIVTRLCLHPSCNMSPPPYFVIKKVEVNEVGKKTGGVFVPDLLEIIVRAVVISAIRAAPHQLGSPLAESLGAGLLQALDYAQLHYDLGSGLEAASAEIGSGVGELSRNTAKLGQGVASGLQQSTPDMIKALDKVLGLDHPTSTAKREAQHIINQDAKKAAGSLASAVSNFSKVLSKGELEVAGNVSSALAAAGSALEHEGHPLAGGKPPAPADMAKTAAAVAGNFSSMLREGQKDFSKMLKESQQSNPLEDLFKNPFEQQPPSKPADNPLKAFGNMLSQAAKAAQASTPAPGAEPAEPGAPATLGASGMELPPPPGPAAFLQ